IGTNGTRLAGFNIQPLDGAVLRIYIDQVGSVSGWDGVFSIASGDREPIGAADAAAAQAVRRTTPPVIVLQPAAEHVRSLIVSGHRVELLDGQIIEIAPGFAGIRREVSPAVVAVDDTIGILRIDPHGVVIHMHSLGSGPSRLAAIF